MTTDNPARRFYDRISRVYDVLSDAAEHHARETGLGLLAIREGEHVLEVGFGTGHSLVELARAVGPTGQVCGVDISEGMREVAARQLEEAGVADRVELSVAEVPPIPWADSSFDAVTLSFTLELFPDPTLATVLTEIRRVLRPGGRLGVVAMAVHADGEHDSPLQRLYNWMHHHFPHIVDCRPIDAGRHLAAAGFAITDRERQSIWSLSVEALVARPEPRPAPPRGE